MSVVATGVAGRLYRAWQRAMLSIVATKPGSVAFRTVLPTIDRLTVKVSGGRVTFTQLVIPTLVLTTTGHRTGLSRDSPLCYLQDGPDLIVVGTNWGQAHHPAWTTNLLTDPAAQVLIGGRSVNVVAHPVEGDDWRRFFARFELLGPNFSAYLVRAGQRVPRMFRLTVSR